jgi:hypothetical protein
MYHNSEALIYGAAQRIIANKGEFNYYDVGEILVGRGAVSHETACDLLALSVICHNIPYYVNNQRLIRNLDECLKDVITFYNANKAELEIIYNSNEKEWTDILSGFTLPKLMFGDDSHYVFKSGSGNARPDLVDSKGNTYEVKRNFRGGSRASLHKADFLIDCKNTTIEVRKITDQNNVDLEHYPLGRFNGFLTEKLVTPTNTIEDPTMNQLWSGELIEAVEARLAKEGFVWNP